MTPTHKTAGRPWSIAPFLPAIMAGDKVLLSIPLDDLPPAETMEQEFLNVKIMKQRALDQFAETAETAFRRVGDKEMLLLVLFLYLSQDILPPKWAREELVNACKAEAKSWNDVFGQPWSKRNKRSRMAEKAYREGQRLRKQGYKISDDSLFPALGKALGISSGRAKDHYYGKAKHGNEKLALAAGLGVPEDKAEQDAIVGLLQQAGMLLRMTYVTQRKIAAMEKKEASLQKHTSEKLAPKIRKNKL